MAESTYKSDALTAVIDWDINQITSANEGMVLADLSVFAYRPSKLEIDETYTFKHSDVYYRFTIKKDDRYNLATQCLLGVYPIVPIKLFYMASENKRA